MLRKLFKDFVSSKNTSQLDDEPNYRDILELMDEGFALCRMIYDTAKNPIDFTFLYINPSFAKLTGLQIKDVIGREARKVIPGVEPLWIETYARVVKTGKSEHFENKAEALNKEFDIMAWRSSPGCFAVIFTEITEKNKLADEAKLSKLIIDSAQNPIFSNNLKGIIKTWNKNAEHLYGYKKEEIIGKSVTLLEPKDRSNEFDTILEKIKEGDKVEDYETIRKTKSGETINVIMSAWPIEDHGEIIGATIMQHDITQTKKNNEKLETNNQELEESKLAMINIMEDLEQAKEINEIEKAKDEAMLASIGDGLIAVDNNRKVTVINKSAESMLGWKSKEVIGQEITSLPMEDEDGHVVPLNKRPTYLALKTGQSMNTIYYFVRKDKTRFPIAINVTPIKIGGKIIGAIDIFRDITNEREIDKAKSEFVSLASHQLRTPLGIMKWYLEALQSDKYFKASPIAIKEYFDEICKNNERVLSLVRSLLSVSRIDQGKDKDEPKLTNIASLVKEVVSGVKLIADKKSIAVDLRFTKEKIPQIKLDPLRFREVIENLVINSIKYTPNEGKVGVSIDKTNGGILIKVSDTGIGISTEDKKKLFTKFFRGEKAVASNPEGSGLGLYVVKSYVEGWGGKISVESLEGKGATFTVSLPLKKTILKKGGSK